MATATTIVKQPRGREAGLAFWMQQVLEECNNASVNFAADPVHDLRVALRRCRSMADGLMRLDPDKSWKQMKRSGKRLFSSLGELRDVQVMMEWVQKLGTSSDSVTHAFQHYLRQREAGLKIQAAEALQRFDRKQWAVWARTLPTRATRLRKGSPLFKHLALERWNAAWGLHRRAMKSLSQVSLHNLRIGVKRFRYIVENFLPEQHTAWKSDLKEMQDLLGEIHDLDVLWVTGSQIKAFPDAESRSRWHQRIVSERDCRIALYRGKSGGRDGLWSQWRFDLPRGAAIREIALQRLRLWASVLDPDFKHSVHVARLALQVFDGLPNKQATEAVNSREALYLAALLHDVGRSRRARNHHKRSYRLITSIAAPAGLDSDELSLVAAVARFHRGALPRIRDKAITGLPRELRQTVNRLAGILRLADAFDCNHDGRITRVRVIDNGSWLLIEAEGYSARDISAQHIAASRHLLEMVCRRPIILKPARAKNPPASRKAKARSRSATSVP